MKKLSEGIFKGVDFTGTDYSAIFEDDGKTAYGYLLKAGSIVSDVWLYNCVPAPDEPEWDKKENAPFLNPRDYVSDQHYPRIQSADEIEFCSYSDKKTGSLAVEIILRGVVFAQMEPNKFPGWSRLANEDGPLALRMVLPE